MEQAGDKAFEAGNDDRSRSGLYERIVLGQLSGMTEGHMRLTLRDGRVVDIGNRQSPDKAMIRVLRDDFFRKCVLFGDVGFGEAYVDGDWETNSITSVIEWFLRNVEHAPTISGNRRKSWMVNVLKGFNKIGHLLRDNSIRGSRKNIGEHYDLSNEFFRNVLDPGMTYSSAYFCRPEMTLEEAQTAKIDRLCREVRLQPSDHVLEIGSGWGGFALHAASRYGCHVTTVTVSEEQFRYVLEKVREAGLVDRIEVQFRDYRAVEGSYDKIVSVEMLEAVGHRHFEEFFAACHRVLKKDGLMGLQVIIAPDSRYDSLRKGVDWIQKHIFPGSLIPSIARINQAVNRTGDLFLHDLKDLGTHYARTLSIWRDNFNRNADAISVLGFDERFRRMWNYYFSYCEAAFARHNISVVQMVYTRPNNPMLMRRNFDSVVP